MELRYYLSIAWKWGWLVVVATALSAGLSYRAVSRTPTLYQASTTLLVGRALQSETPNPNDAYTDQGLAKDYSVLARSQTILQATIDSLGLKESWESLYQQTNTSVLQGSDTFDVQVVDIDPQRAKVIADEIARQLVLASPTPKQGDTQRQFANQQMAVLQTEIQNGQAQIADLQKRVDTETSAVTLNDLNNQLGVWQQKVSAWQSSYTKLSDFYQGSTTNYLTVATPATVPTAPVGTKKLYSVGLAAVIGLLLALGGIVVAEVLDDTVKSRQHAVRTLGLPLLGGIGRIPGVRSPSDALFVLKTPQSSSAEACRFLSTNVGHEGSPDGATVLLMTSPGPREGTSMLAANLAVTIAETGKRVILVDANLRRPVLHQFFGLSNREGLSTLLLDSSMSVDSVLRPSMVPSLRVLTSGALVPNPSSLLGSRGLVDCLAEIRSLADVVVLDSASILGASETATLASMSDEIVLVVKIGRTRRPAVRETTALLAQLGLTIHGFAINGESVGRSSYQRYYALPVGVAAPVTQEECPHLGLRTDRASVVRGATAEHRCYAAAKPTKITTAHQQAYCLCSAHSTCPRLIQVRPPIQVEAGVPSPTVDTVGVNTSEKRESGVAR